MILLLAILELMLLLMTALTLPNNHQIIFLLQGHIQVLNIQKYQKMIIQIISLGLVKIMPIRWLGMSLS